MFVYHMSFSFVLVMYVACVYVVKVNIYYKFFNEDIQQLDNNFKELKSSRLHLLYYGVLYVYG